MRRVKSFAMNLGLGIGAVYCFFLIPAIEGLFTASFITLLRQILVITFAVCLLISPEKIIDLGIKIAPKMIAILDIITGRKHTNNNRDESTN